MRVGVSAAATALTAAALLVPACSSSTSSSGPGGSGGGNLQQITAVNLNTDGTSPGGANTGQVVIAATTFLASLDDTQRGKVQYDFSNNKARQTWSNFPTTAVPREGIVLADLNADQQKAATAAPSRTPTSRRPTTT